MTTYSIGITPSLTLARQRRVLVHLIGVFLPLLRMMAANPFAENVRPTEALTPELEQKSFYLPPGFEVQLVAAEPDISKPMNLAFDATGRLWVSTSREYPFPAPPDKPARDRIMIFLLRRAKIRMELQQVDAARSDAARALALLQEATGPNMFSCLTGRAYLALGHALGAQRQAQ